MKKVLLSLAAIGMTLSASAATKILYQQDFESITDAAAAGWSFATSAGELTPTDNGKYLKIAVGSTKGGRTATFKFGDIFTANGESLLEDGIYTLKYDFAILNGKTDKYDSSFDVFTNHAPITNQPYRNPWSPAGTWDSYLFNMRQVASKQNDYTVNDGSSINFPNNSWFTVELKVDVDTRDVNYKLTKSDGTLITEGTRSVPATNPDGSEISMLAEGIHLILARQSTTVGIDNISVTCESSDAVANKPVVALARVGQTADGVENLNLRAYAINFLSGETLHITGTDGANITATFDSCNGTYTYETTVSGTFSAWTTCGNATSEAVEETVDCAPIQLPAVSVALTGLKEGWSKKYGFSVDNSAVLLKPAIAINYSFTGKSGNVVTGTGNSFEADEEGALLVTTTALGYQSATVAVNNDQKLAVKKTYDFARMTEEDLANIFPPMQTLNSTSTSGFNCWTGRKRIYYKNEAGSTVYPFSSEPFMKYAVINNSEEPTVDGTCYFEGLTVFPPTAKGNKNLGIILHVGIYNDQTDDNYNDITVHGLAADDYVSFDYINGYGANSNHPVCANVDEFYAQLHGEEAGYVAGKDGVEKANGTFDVTYPLFRIDTACTKITVYKKDDGTTTGLNDIKVNAPADNAYYTLEGIRLAQPTRPGLYIHNGKKVIIK